MKEGYSNKIIKDKKDAKYVPLYHKSFEERIEVLKNAKSAGENIVTDHRGFLLYSLFQSEYEWWKIYTGGTKEEYIAKELQHETEERAKLMPVAKPYLDRAEKVLYPERMAEFEKMLFDSIKQFNYQKVSPVIAIGLDYVEKLENGSTSREVKRDIAKANFSGIEYNIKGFVFRFYKKGPEFLRKVDPKLLKGEGDQEYIKQIIAENKKFEQNELLRQQNQQPQ